MGKVIDGVENCWNILIELNSDDVAKKCLVSFLPSENSFLINVLNEQYKISLKDREIYNTTNPDEKISYDLKLLILYYLSHPSNISLSNEPTVSYRNLKGGDTFFTAGHTIDEKSIIEKYALTLTGLSAGPSVEGSKPKALEGNSKELFLKTGKSLGAEQTFYGDASFKLNVLPLVPMYLILWLGDEEIKTNISILFDKVIESQFPLEIIYALIKTTIKKIVKD